MYFNLSLFHTVWNAHTILSNRMKLIFINSIFLTLFHCRILSNFLYRGQHYSAQLREHGRQHEVGEQKLALPVLESFQRVRNHCIQIT